MIEANVVPALRSFILPKVDQIGHNVYLMTVYQYNHLNCRCVIGAILVRERSQIQNWRAIRRRCIQLRYVATQFAGHNLQGELSLSLFDLTRAVPCGKDPCMTEQKATSSPLELRDAMRPHVLHVTTARNHAVMFIGHLYIPTLLTLG